MKSVKNQVLDQVWNQIEKNVLTEIDIFAYIIDGRGKT